MVEEKSGDDIVEELLSDDIIEELLDEWDKLEGKLPSFEDFCLEYVERINKR
jgi:hypothetical protein